MHMYAKCDQNIPCGLRVMNIFTRRTHIVIIVQIQGSCNLCHKNTKIGNKGPYCQYQCDGHLLYIHVA